MHISVAIIKHVSLYKSPPVDPYKQCIYLNPIEFYSKPFHICLFAVYDPTIYIVVGHSHITIKRNISTSLAVANVHDCYDLVGQYQFHISMRLKLKSDGCVWNIRCVYVPSTAFNVRCLKLLFSNAAWVISIWVAVATAEIGTKNGR